MLKKSILASILLAASCSSCAEPPPVFAERCYVIEGSRDRYVELDEMFRSMTSESGFSFKGDDSSALVVKDKSSKSLIISSSPFGPYTSIVSLYSIDKKNRDLDDLLDLLLARASTLGLHAKHCSAVPELSTPSIHGSADY